MGLAWTTWESAGRLVATTTASPHSSSAPSPRPISGRGLFFLASLPVRGWRPVPPLPGRRVPVRPGPVRPGPVRPEGVRP
ncbi:MAG TPA: hypothetical protein DEA08_33765, partial [Planctomycetes bacterium]|nr:hypothetical protein [Planctomycetota bacterium]